MVSCNLLRSRLIPIVKWSHQIQRTLKSDGFPSRTHKCCRFRPYRCHKDRCSSQCRAHSCQSFGSNWNGCRGLWSWLETGLIRRCDLFCLCGSNRDSASQLGPLSRSNWWTHQIRQRLVFDYSNCQLHT